ncbi:MAG: hypothetical protein KBA31_00155 [Alphaproteobacteria bacterium]|nr:hypothetical protein [Alphaproteobacteria bacterium]
MAADCNDELVIQRLMTRLSDGQSISAFVPRLAAEAKRRFAAAAAKKVKRKGGLGAKRPASFAHLGNLSFDQNALHAASWDRAMKRASGEPPAASSSVARGWDTAFAKVPGAEHARRPKSAPPSGMKLIQTTRRGVPL